MLKDIVMTCEEQDVIRKWADKNYHEFRPNGQGRQFLIFNQSVEDIKDIPDWILQMGSTVLDGTARPAEKSKNLL